MSMDFRDPRTQKLALVVLGLLAIGYYYFMTETFSFTHRSRGLVLGELRVERDRLAQDVIRARAVGDQLATLSRERETLAQRWLELESRLPSEHDRADFLTEVTRLGREEQLQFFLFEPKPAQPAEFYQEVGVQVQVKGNYDQVGRFLAELANLSRIVRVSSLKLSSESGPKQDEGPAVTAEMVITTFYLQSGAGSGTPPARSET